MFDGHGGWACAQAVSERLLSYVAIAMMSLRSLEELEWLMEQGRPVPAVLQWYKHRGDVSYQKSASFYREQLRVFWQELLDHGEHSDGMRCVWSTLTSSSSSSSSLLIVPFNS